MGPAFRHCVDNATFIAIDTEFTGLGSARGPMPRYTVLSEVVNGHALVAMGITTFEKKPAQTLDPAGASSSSSATKRGPTAHYRISNFNFLLVNSKDHVISPDSMAFLVDNGFDFNRLFRDGIPYYPGDDHPDCPPDSSNSTIRGLFDHVLNRGVPVIVHNGLLDVMFLYRSFHADLPTDVNVLIEDLTAMFTGGIYDTKVVSDYVTREQTSFLAYLFRNERKQLKRKLNDPAQPLPPLPFITWDIADRTTSPASGPQLAGQSFAAETAWQRPEEAKRANKRKKPPARAAYCSQYANHGHCISGRLCTLSHDLDIILDYEEQYDSSGKKRQRTENGGEGEDDGDASAKKRLSKTENGDEAHGVEMNGSDGASKEDSFPDTAVATEAALEVKKGKAQHDVMEEDAAPLITPLPAVVHAQPGTVFETYHSACFDAFMTGFVFAVQLAEHPEILEKQRNMLYLMGKERPLPLKGSSFSKTSQGHRNRVERAAKERIG
ncbi:Target of EGR1, member 1 (Nuclear) [Irineochytrium annulatum]|nr:Target of EGR1, member 1 (Nuclear) [Irineochytrium annulatum]